MKALVFHVLLLFSLLLICTNRVVGDTFIVNGKYTYTYEVTSSKQDLLDKFYEYENESNSQKVIRREKGKITVVNKAKLAFFDSKTKYPPGDLYRSDLKLRKYLDLALTENWYIVEKKGGETKRRDFVKRFPLSNKKITRLRVIANQLVKSSQYQYEAVEKIMTHIRQNVSYQLGTSSDPLDVLKTGKAYCEGYANVTVTLLRVLGIPARVVTCYLSPGHMWGIGGVGSMGSGGFHAYTEVYYKDNGWVSYDPQATVHYVDPFHIVNYPEKGLRIKDIFVKDTLKITDSKRKPNTWRDFFKRRTVKKQHSAILIGRVINRSGEVVKDSYRTKNWVFKPSDKGVYKGIRILWSGFFAIPTYELNKPVTFFYKGKNGGYLEKRIAFSKIEKKEMLFDLSDQKKTVIIKVPGRRKNLSLWRKGRKGQWKVHSLGTNKSNTIAFLLDNGKYILSRGKSVNEPRYVLDISGNVRSRSRKLTDLDLYCDPSKPCVHGQIRLPKGKIMSYKLKIVTPSGKYYPIATDEKGQFAYSISDKTVNLVILESPGHLFIKSVNLSQSRKMKVDIDLSQARISLILPDRSKALILWKRDENNKWRLFKYRGDSRGKIILNIDNGEYILSQSNQLTDPRYVLKVDRNPSSSLSLRDLPYYRDPSQYYVFGQIKGFKGKPMKATIYIADSKGAHYPPVKTNTLGQYNYLVTDPKFNLIVAKAPGFLGIKRVRFSRIKHNNIDFNLKSKTFSRIITGKHKKVYFFIQRGNSYYQYAEASADGKGRLFFRVPSGTYHLSPGRSVGKSMIKIKVKEGSKDVFQFK